MNNKLQENQIAVFAETNYRNSSRKFGIKTDDRRRHMYIIGKTGTGKSTLLENLIIEDIRVGNGVAVVDPHGELAENVIKHIPTNRINDVVYFNPADYDYPIAFNVVEHVEPQFRHLVASGLVGVFQKLWADSWGPRLEYILRNTILAILDYPGSTLLGLLRMLADKKFRKTVIEKIQDPVVKSFWVNEFAGYADKFASEAVSPIQNKVGQFLSTSLIRNIVGQVKSTISMRDIMDEGKILIINLSKGRIGEDSSALLGAMMITKIQLAAMSRVDTPEAERKDFYLYIDEFQNFTTESFANIMSEARKYRLNLTIAHQYVEQLGDLVKAAVFGNVGTLILFRVGAADAEELVPEFAPTFTEEDLVNLPKFEFYLKLMIDGIASEPFSARGLPPMPENEETGNAEKVINVSRERYATERTLVEDRIARWHQNGGDDGTGPNVKNRKDSKPVRATVQATKRPVKAYPAPQHNTLQSRSPRSDFPRPGSGQTEPKTDNVYKHEAVCSRCGKNTTTSFVPDGVRPVYCRDCLSLVRTEKRDEIENRKTAKQAELARLEKEENSENTEPPVKVETISLQDALSHDPIKFSRSRANKDSKKLPSSPKPAEPEKSDGEIVEGEEVKIVDEK